MPDPDLLPIRPAQPVPLSTQTAYFRGITAISRLWDRRTIGNCKLCPPNTCTAGDRGMCLVQVVGMVNPGEAPLFRLPPSCGRGANGATG